MLSIQSYPNYLELKSGPVAASCLLNTDIIPKKLEQSLVLKPIIDLDSFWNRHNHTISIPGQFSQNGIEIESKKYGDNRLYFEVLLDGVRLTVVPTVENLSSAVEKIGETDILIINIDLGQVDLVTQFINNCSPRVVVLCGNQEYIRDFSAKTIQELVEIEGAYKLKTRPAVTETLQYIFLKV